jgi:hypothetical protein
MVKVPELWTDEEADYLAKRATEQHVACTACGVSDERCTKRVLTHGRTCCYSCGRMDTHPQAVTAVPFSKAEVGQEAYTYEGEAMDEYGWVTDLEYFDDRYGEVKLTRKLWRLVEVEEIVLPDPHPIEDDDDQ